MAKPDPKDDQIAELQLRLEAANQATSKAETKAQEVGALQAELAKSQATISGLEKKVEGLQKELEVFRTKTTNRPIVVGLDPERAVQLRVSSVVTNAITMTRIDAVAGDVLVESSFLEETQKKIGTSAKIHPVSKDEIVSAKSSGRAY
jgi:hypothetical protein